MRRILLVDDHPYIRVGLRSLLINSLLAGEVLEAGSLKEANLVLSQQDLDLVICDISMGKESGIDLLERWGKKVAFIMLSIFEAQVYVEKCLSLGAKAYLAKGTDPKQLLDTVNRILHEIPLRKAVALQTPQPENHVLKNLSPQEINILLDLANGIGMREIAARRGLGYTTVATYKKRIMDKTGVSNMGDLIRLAIKFGLLQP